MKKFLVLLVVAAFVVSSWGCASKSEYDKLMDQKKVVEKKVTELNAEKAKLKKTITSREMQIKDLKAEVSKTATAVSQMEKELNSLKSQIKSPR